MNQRDNSKRSKYRPTFNLVIPSDQTSDKELSELNIAHQIFYAYNDTKKILWTSKFIAEKEIQSITQKTVIINLVPEEHYDCNNPFVKYFHIPIADDILSGNEISNNFSKILESFRIWENDNDITNMIIHCKMGVHRSFTVATILTMFLHHKQNSPRDYIPKQSDYDKFVNDIQNKNKYIFSPACFNETQISDMYNLFIKVH